MARFNNRDKRPASDLDDTSMGEDDGRVDTRVEEDNSGGGVNNQADVGEDSGGGGINNQAGVDSAIAASAMRIENNPAEDVADVTRGNSAFAASSLGMVNNQATVASVARGNPAVAAPTLGMVITEEHLELYRRLAAGQMPQNLEQGLLNTEDDNQTPAAKKTKEKNTSSRKVAYSGDFQVDRKTRKATVQSGGNAWHHLVRTKKVVNQSFKESKV
jgi:hypothetical protein